MRQSRTHTCGELRLTDAGKTVTIAGWMENLREVGANFAFLVLRDYYGTTQVVIQNEEMMARVKGVNKESTLQVTGIVRERESKNPKQATGDIEIEPTDIQVLGKCRYNSLPFEINKSKEADENTRLKYRFLDLRNPAVKKNIVLRCNVVARLRQLMTQQGFLEITTPILTSSSPEGARDYLVPARNHPGKFYALPQAPQQFKQLLMTAGFDKYFQIAPCFRDEDARADRTPGEFYQLDMEMAFASQEDVLDTLETVLVPVFEEFGKYKRVSQAPFRHIPYKEAMERYGSDKPDLRIDLEIQDVTDLVQGCGFGPFEGNTVKAVAVEDFHETRKWIDKLVADVEVQTGNKACWFRLDENGALVGGISKCLPDCIDGLKERLGLLNGRLLGGVIWGVWHWPLMLLVGYEYGTNYLGAPLLGLVVWCVVCFALNTLLDWLYEKTGCIWVPAIAHGALNAVASIPVVLTDPAEASYYTVLGPMPIGLIGMLPVLAVAVWLTLRQMKQEEKN